MNKQEFCLFILLIMGFYSTVEKINLEKTTFQLDISSIYECHIKNGNGPADIFTRIGFGYYKDGNIHFISGAYDSDQIGCPIPYENIYPFGSVKCNLNVMDSYNNGENIKFYCVTGHKDGNGDFIMDSYDTVNITIQYVPQEPLCLVTNVSVSNNSPDTGEEIEITGTVKNGGAAGFLKVNLGIGYMASPGEIVILNGGWLTMPGLIGAGQSRDISMIRKVTQSIFDNQTAGKNILAFCLGKH